MCVNERSFFEYVVCRLAMRQGPTFFLATGASGNWLNNGRKYVKRTTSPEKVLFLRLLFFGGKITGMFFWLFEKGNWSWNVLIFPDPFKCGARTSSVKSTSEKFCSRNGTRACTQTQTKRQTHYSEVRRGTLCFTKVMVTVPSNKRFILL